ncbi:hypothetical protein LCGC14_2105110 [marine sediment metagenome]|uniref:Uncharacterized protein n=1 Tax=marine sediment metagenome TaxID=412755 RepID=A0A0F9EW12_9ZZZZ
MATKEFLWRCPDHPDAMILHSWDETQYVFNDGYPRGSGVKKNHRWECNECGLELKADMEE